MVNWIGKFDFLLKRAKDSWMDMLPLSSMTEQQRQTKYQADMARLNAERQSRSEAVLDLNQPATKAQLVCLPTSLQILQKLQSGSRGQNTEPEKNWRSDHLHVYVQRH